MPRGCLQLVIVVFLDHTHLLFLVTIYIMCKLKFLLDRKSLETIISFILPILEYGNVVCANYTQPEKQDIEKIQNEAARIVTGRTKLFSIH